MEILGSTLDMLGKVMVSFTVLRVHFRFWKEHRVDEKVFSEMKKERFIGMIGIGLMILGYVIELIPKL